MNFARLIASGFGSGYAPKAPGTAGSVVGLALGGAALAISPWLLPLLTLAASIGGTCAIMQATGLPLRPATEADHDDPGWIVIDEIAGRCCALLLLPRPSWEAAALAFALFRLLDITKPGPIGWLDRQGGAFGIMADDLLAGALAALLVALAHALWPGTV
jgi:phosphatidylglycerophosphatase A